MRVFVEIMGERILQRKLHHVAATRQNMRNILGGPVADVVFEIENQIFSSEGRRGGGSWKRLTPGWLNYKIRHGLDPRIGHATLALRRAFTVREAPHQHMDLTSQTLRLWSDLPQAVPQQENRPFVKFTRDDRAEIAQVIRDALREAWRVG